MTSTQFDCLKNLVFDKLIVDEKKLCLTTKFNININIELSSNTNQRKNWIKNHDGYLYPELGKCKSVYMNWDQTVYFGDDVEDQLNSMYGSDCNRKELKVFTTARELTIECENTKIEFIIFNTSDNFDDVFESNIRVVVI